MDSKKEFDGLYGDGTWEKMRLIHGAMYDLGISPKRREAIFNLIGAELLDHLRKTRLERRKNPAK